MGATRCTCGTGSCPGCGVDAESFWCESCRTVVTEKRCPLCGLKTKKIRQQA